VIEDCYDGELYKEAAQTAREVVAGGICGGAKPMFTTWRMTNDPCELTVDGSSWTPVLFVCMSLMPWWRAMTGAMHLGMLLPPGVKNLSLLLPYFLSSFMGAAGCQLKGGRGVLVPPLAEGGQATRVFAEIVAVSNDTRATPMANCMRQAPALVGASTHSWLEGQYFKGCGATYYVQHIRFTPERSPLRRRWKEAFGGAPALLPVGDQLTPRLKTHAAVVAAGQRGADEKRRRGATTHAAKLSGYYDVDAFARHYPGWDSARRFFDCSAHTLLNCMRDTFMFMGDCKKMKFNTKRSLCVYYYTCCVYTYTWPVYVYTSHPPPGPPPRVAHALVRCKYSRPARVYTIPLCMQYDSRSLRFLS
jgi:hypothetical protein